MADYQLGNLVYKITGNTTDFDNGVVTSEKKMLKFANTAKVAGAAIGLAVIATGTAAVKAAADMENMEVAFKVMLGSAEKAKKLLTDIQKLSVKTPFTPADLSSATKTMLAFGIALEDVMPNLQMLGDIALGDKNKLNQLTLAFSQIQSTGRLMGQDLLQLINAGFNPLQTISEKTGKSIAVLKKEMEQGAISAEMVADAFKAATSEGGRFFGGSEEASKTLSGQLSTLEGNVQLLAASLGEYLLPIVNKTVAEFNKFFNFLDKTKLPAAEQEFYDLGQSIGISTKGLLDLNTAFSDIGFKFDKAYTDAISLQKLYKQSPEKFFELGFKLSELTTTTAARTNLLSQEFDALVSGLSLTADGFIEAARALGVYDGLEDTNTEKAIGQYYRSLQAKEEVEKKKQAAIAATAAASAESLVTKQLEYEQLADLDALTLLNIENVTKAYQDATRLRLEATQRYVDQAGAMLGSFFSSINAIQTNFDTAEVQRLEEKIERETEGSATRLALEKQLYTEKKKLAREQAKRDKALRAFRATIDTASAIIGFLADPGGIPGIALSVGAGITGAASLAAIASEPLPQLANGAIIPAGSNATVKAGEGSVSEAFIPLNKETMRELGKAIAENIPGGDMNLSVNVQGGGSSRASLSLDDIYRASLRGQKVINMRGVET